MFFSLHSVRRLMLAAGTLLAATFGSAQTPSVAIPYSKGYVHTGNETIAPEVQVVDRPARRTLDEPLGELFIMGMTYYDYQQNGTFGKQIAVDQFGYVHGVWTNLTSGSITAPRHVYYNVWSPEIFGFTLPSEGNPVGVSVDNNRPRAGFCNVAVNDSGWAFPVLHQTSQSRPAEPHSGCGVDYLPRNGAFQTDDLPYLNGDPQIIWPKVACDINGDLHTVHTQSGGSSLDYYRKGTPDYFDDGTGCCVLWDDWVEWEPANFITIDVAASFHTEKIAVAWINDAPEQHGGNNIYLRTSDDAGETWNDVINVTNFFPIDTMCVRNGGSAVECNGDTLRPWIDLSVIIDANDVTHVAFSVTGWYYWWPENDSAGPWMLNMRPSQIWHWDEVRQEYNIMAEAWYGRLPSGFGVNQLMCHRPNLAVDTVTNELFCSYQLYDTAQTSVNDHPQADAWITRSNTGGRLWSVGTNVTRTDGGQLTPPPGCMTEIDINLARTVTDGVIHMQYCLDHDAGSAVISTPIGAITYNEMIYLRVPVDSIPLRPFVNPYRALRVDSTGYPWDLDTTDLAAEYRGKLAPESFALYQNFPNPFNPTTEIQFDLSTESVVSLRVFDVLGRETANLLDGRVEAGAHVVTFDATALPSGVYFYRLETPQGHATKKMVLMK